MVVCNENTSRQGRRIPCTPTNELNSLSLSNPSLSVYTSVPHTIWLTSATPLSCRYCKPLHKWHSFPMNIISTQQDLKMNCPQDCRLPSAIVMRAMLICAYIMNSNGVDVSLRLSLSLSLLAVDGCVGYVYMYVCTLEWWNTNRPWFWLRRTQS